MRLGCLPYLNVKPLVYTLERGELPQDWQLVYAPPARLAEMILDGEIAAAPVSSYAAIACGFDFVPGICIAADGPVRSVLMLSRKPVSQVRTLAIDSGSLSGANMLRIVLRESCGIDPETVRMAPTPVEAMLEACDAALVIGNPAMQCSKDGLVVTDVSEQWRRLTGLPAVFALWAGKAITTQMVQVLARAKAVGIAAIPEIAREESVRLGLPFDVCHQYLARTIIYDLGEREVESLEVFRLKLLEHGLLPMGTCLK